MDALRTLPVNFAFGRCRILGQRRELLRDGRPVALGARAFDLLLALVAARGGVVAKDVLMARVWPGRIVEENSIEAQVSAVRRALGPDRGAIRTVAGRGYQFVGEIVEDYAVVAPAAVRRPLPLSVSPLIGRDTAQAEIIELMGSNRLLTLVGTGGIGKTRLALEVARRLAARFPDGVSLAELGALSAAEFVPAALAEALGFPHGAGTASLDRIASVIADKQVLVVLDNCEHLVEAAARVTDSLLRAGARVRVLATSREPLRIAGEYVYRVPSLEVPEEAHDDAADVQRFAAVQLFDARVHAALGHPLAGSADAALKARICRRLDGIPLAIELAAARVPVFGLDGVAQRLDDRFNLLTGGSRTSLPRQQTLRATLDWSYDLLSAAEREALGRLSVFAGPFEITGAIAVAADFPDAPEALCDALAGLVDKSLVVAMVAGNGVRYRLLETPRAYAAAKLAGSGAQPTIATRHARHFRDVFARALAEWDTRAASDWLADYGRHLEDLRAAVDWSFAPGGDAATGIALTAAAVPLWMQLSLLEECLRRADLALAILARERLDDERSRLELVAARATSLLYQGAGADTGAAFAALHALALRMGDAENRLRACWGLWGVAYLNGAYGESAAQAREFARLADEHGAANDRRMGERMLAMSLTCVGRLAEARRRLDRVLADPVVASPRANPLRYIYDQRVVAQTALAAVLWLEGLADQACRAADGALALARGSQHPPSLCYAIAEGMCVITLLTRGPDALDAAVAAVVDATRRHGVSTWKARGRLWAGLRQLARGDADAYERDVRPAIEEIGAPMFVHYYTGVVAAICDALGRCGNPREGIALARRAADRAERSGDRCSLSELMRVQGELLLRIPGSGDAADAMLGRALAHARQHEARAWELRCATSVARRLRGRGQPDAARALLRPVYERFVEGRGTFDLVAARALLDAG